jgi:2-polyprenyl-3-methyl-5-hydroxy-6-metoxy-1,4-benzoquinol methylase
MRDGSRTRCLVCGAPAYYVFQQKGYHFSECAEPGCRHVFVSPVPSTEEIRALYATDEPSIRNSDSWVMAADYAAAPEVVHKHYERTRTKWLRRQGMLAAGTSILDVGCSTGVFLRVLADLGFNRVHGVDLSERHCLYVREKHRIPCDTSLNAVPDGLFDLVTCYAVVEHTPDPVAFVDAMARKLRPGGHLMVQVPNFRSFYRALSGSTWLWLIPPIHLQYFGPSSLSKTLERCRLDVTVKDSAFTSTYVYLLAYHATRLIGRNLPQTNRSGRSLTMLTVNALEAVIRAAIYPIAAIARRSHRHNELNFVARKPSSDLARSGESL